MGNDNEREYIEAYKEKEDKKYGVLSLICMFLIFGLVLGLVALIHFW